MNPCATYPVTYVEASVAMMKMNAARVLGFLPIALAAGAAVGWRYFSAPVMGLLVGVQIAIVVLLMQPYCSLLKHSAGTTDTKCMTWMSLLLGFAMLISVFLFLPAAVAFFVFVGSVVAWAVAPVVMLAAGVSFWRFYGYVYTRGRIDWMASGT